MIPGRKRRIAPIMVLLLATGASSGAARGPRKRGPWVVGRVTAVTEHRVYVDLGRRFGLRREDPLEIRIPGGRWIKLALSDLATGHGSALLPEGGPLPPRGAPARARWRPATDRQQGKDRAAAELPPVESLARLTARWRGVELARPTLVRHRPNAPSARLPLVERPRGSLRLEYLAQLNLGTTGPSSYHRVGLWSDLDLPRLLTDWIDYSHRLRVRVHLARDIEGRRFQDSRPIPLVYRLRLGLGRGPLRAELGRMQGAPLPAATMVDGASARAGLTDWLSLGAFGGMLPRSEDLRPTVDASHFGGYASLRLGAAKGQRKSWSMSADLGLIGTTWQGQLDRKAISAYLSFDGLGLTIEGQAALDLYADDHPSGLSGPNLSLLGASLELRPVSWLELGARFDRYRWVPTLEQIAAFSEAFVVGDPATSLRAFIDGQLAGITVGLQAGWDRQEGDRQGGESWTAWAELMARFAALLADGDQLRIAGGVNRGHLLVGVGGRLAYLLPLADWLRGRISYGLHRDSYHETELSLWRHNVAGGIEATLGRHWLAGAEALLQSSEEERLLQLLATASYHF
jgi:hypothetical protein